MTSSLIDKLQELMDAKGFNARSLSLAAKLNPTAVRDILSGRSAAPRSHTLLRLAQTLNADPRELMLASGMPAEEVEDNIHLRKLSHHDERFRMYIESDFNFDSIKELDIELQGNPGVNFALANMQNAKFSGGDFSSSIFAGANLRNADLSHANLSRCVFTRADLSGATFEGADLRRAIFTSAKMEGTNLVDARMEGAVLDGVDLTAAILRRQT